MIKKFFKFIAFILCICVCAAAVANCSMVFSKYQKQTVDSIEGKYDCIIILGASVLSDGTPCQMLADRLDTGIALYKKGVSERILLSGYTSTEDIYDEIKAMKKYCLDREVPETAIFTDGYGLCTYDSVVRAKRVYCANSAVIVTQKYHLDRALYVAGYKGLDAVGVACDKGNGGYTDILNNQVREIFARTKAFFYCILNVQPKNLGEAQNIKGVQSDFSNDTASNGAEIYSEISDNTDGTDLSAQETQAVE